MILLPLHFKRLLHKLDGDGDGDGGGGNGDSGFEFDPGEVDLSFDPAEVDISKSDFGLDAEGPDTSGFGFSESDFGFDVSAPELDFSEENLSNIFNALSPVDKAKTNITKAMNQMKDLNPAAQALLSYISPVPLTPLVAGAVGAAGLFGQQTSMSNSSNDIDMDMDNERPDRGDSIFDRIQTPQKGNEMADQTDMLADLMETVQGFEGQRISAKVGNQEFSFLPKAQRDELSMLLNYMLEKEKITEGAYQFGQKMDLEKPSTIDKASQLIGLGSDAMSVWKGVSSLF